MTTTRTMNGGTVVARVLQRWGVGTVFALAGEAHYTILEALHRDGVAIVSHRHESAAVAAADGYSRITNRLGVAQVLPNMGLANAIGGLAAAYEACSPVLVLVAHPPRPRDQAGALQDTDQLALARPVTKWARMVYDANQIEEYLDAACRVALSGRPGPVLLSVPMELLAAHVERVPAEVSPQLASPPRADPRAIDRAVELLAGARRPLVLAGSGAARGGAGDGLRRLAALGFPVLGNALGRGLVPEDFVSGFSWAIGQDAAAEADVVLAVGIRLSRRLGFGLPPRWRSEARFIQIDIDDAEPGRIRPVEVPITAATGPAVEALAEALADQGVRRDPSWVADAIAARLARNDARAAEPTERVHPLRMARAVMTAMPEDSLVVADGADVLGWFQMALRMRQFGYLDHSPLGSMGTGTPLALGAAAASIEVARRTGSRPRRVTLVTGDGSFGFYAAEWNGAVMAGLPITAVVSNDGGWGTERHFQLRMMGHTVNTELGNPRYDQVAAAFGAYGERVDQEADLAGALQRAFAQEGPAVVDVLTDPHAGGMLRLEYEITTASPATPPPA